MSRPPETISKVAYKKSVAFLKRYEAANRRLLRQLIAARDAMQAVHDNWERGDLAGAVNMLPIDEATSAIDEARAVGIREEPP